MNRNMVCKDVVAALGIRIRPSIEFDGQRVSYSTVAQLLAVASHGVRLFGISVDDERKTVATTNGTRFMFLGGVRLVDVINALDTLIRDLPSETRLKTT